MGSDARGGAKRTPVQVDMATQTEKVEMALRSNDFVDLTAEILRNTMFNLMQEVTYDEFPVDAEPLAFYHKD